MRPTVEGRRGDWLVGGGEMGELVRAKDWARTPLGPLEDWPQSLRTAVSLCLSSNFPINIIWGPEHVQIYNDGYRVVCGDVHPRALGENYSVTWASAWPVIGDSFGRALGGERMFLENQRMFLKRLHGTELEETFFTFSHSPIRDESGAVGGLFHPVTETTATMLSERRTRALRDLSSGLALAADEADLASRTVGILSRYEFDLPFLLHYVLEPASGAYRLAAHHGLEAGGPAAPPVVEPDGAPWNFAAALAGQRIVEVELPPILEGAACGPYEQPPTRGFVIPIAVPSAERAPAVLVTGASSRLPFTADYRSFYDLLRVTIASAMATVRAREDERRRAEALAEIDRAKTAFFSNVSHEFRTPLTLMLGPLEDALASPALRDEERDKLVVAQRNSLRLLKLVNTLLDFSRIEAGRARAVYEPADLAAVTAELASVFRSAIEKAGLDLAIDCPPLPEPIYVDREMWEKIVLNLISNAFKFTFEGRITVRLHPVEGGVELSVRDTGTGVPAHELPRLFERFHRVSGARGRTHEGTGIGLALVLELTKLHGGSVTAESELGRGSVFRVRIPLGRDHLPADQVGGTRTLASTALAASHFVEEALRWLPDEPGAERPREDVAGAGAAPADPAPRARILLADDNADMRDYVRRLLASRYDVEAVADGEEALEAIARRRPELVLTDIMMPRLDGMELLARVRADPGLSTLPVILLSARAGEEARVEGMQSGADDYLIKPFSARELLARVEAHVRMARLRAESEQAVRGSEDRLRLRNARLVILSDALEHLLSSKAPDRIVRDLFPKVAAHLNVDTYFNYMVGPDQRLTLHSCAGIPPEVAESIRQLDYGQAICGTVAQTLQPIIATDIQNSDYDKAALVRGFGIQAYACNPLMSGGRLLGTLSFASHSRGFFEEDELHFMRLIAHYVAIAMDRAQAEATLRESEERFRRMADSAPVMIWVTDQDGACTFLSRSWHAFTGRPPEAAGLDRLAAVHPEDREAARAALLAAETAREPFRAEYRLRRHDGEYRWAIDAAVPRSGEGGEFLGYIGSVIDLTERKQAEDTQKLLTNELNHRVKNTLASVQAIAQHTLRRTRDPEAFVDSFTGRVQSLARVHSMLTATTWKSADLRELIRDQLLHGAADDSRLTAWGPPVNLEPEMALHLALMLHELGTNAVKYGAWSTPAGRVTIRWTVEDRTLRLRWEERDGPPPRAPRARGFGTTLIEQSVKGHGGRAQMLFEAEGVAWDIGFPLPDRPARDGAAFLRDSGDREPARGTSHEEPQRGRLAGKRLLVVEDEPLVALDMEAALAEGGAASVATAGTEEEAIALIGRERFDAALLDGNLGGKSVDEVAAALTRHHVPFSFVTGYGRESLPTSFRNAPVLSKPFSNAQLLETCARLTGGATGVLRLRER